MKTEEGGRRVMPRRPAKKAKKKRKRPSWDWKDHVDRGVLRLISDWHPKYARGGQ